MSTRGRIDGIDFWRGIALLTIFINHVPDNIFSHVTHKNFGFSDAAEAFVFLSGISVALAYGSSFLKGETSRGILALGRRAFTLYWVQVLLSFLVIAVFAATAFLLGNDDLLEDENRDAVLSHPVRGIVAILGLTHQLDFINILPLYIIFLLAAPVLLLLARRSRWLMLAASVALYGVARLLALNLPTWPVEGGWYFNPFAWQLLFVMGLFIGLQLKTDESRAGIPYDVRLLAGSALLLVAAAFVVTSGFGLFHDLWENVRATGALDIHKSDLGLARLVHFLALAYVIRYSGLTKLVRVPGVFEPVAMMGRYSLPVFATGSFLSAVAQLIEQARPEKTTEPSREDLVIGFVIVICGVLIHYLVARFLAARSAARKVTQPRTPSRIAQPGRAMDPRGRAVVAPAS